MRKKEIIQMIGEEIWNDFSEWMAGQTVGIYEDGEINYYCCDVEAFNRKLITGYDRQQDLMAWD